MRCGVATLIWINSSSVELWSTASHVQCLYLSIRISSLDGFSPIPDWTAYAVACDPGRSPGINHLHGKSARLDQPEHAGEWSPPPVQILACIQLPDRTQTLLD